MSTVPCGSAIARHGAGAHAGAAGCLVVFPDLPDKLFLLTAGHVLVGRSAQRFDPVEAEALPGRSIGVLFGWTRLEGEITTDAALVQVDPAAITPEIGALGVPKGLNLDVPKVGMALNVFALGQKRSATVTSNDAAVAVVMTGPDFAQHVLYTGQIQCGSLGPAGVDGSMALDDDGKVVGMVVGGDGATFSLVTPIDAILTHPDWGNGPPLELVEKIPATAKAPVMPAPTPAPPAVRGGDADGAAMAAGQKQIAWGRHVSPAFKAKVIDICGRLDMDPSHLMACMAFETGQSFSAKKTNPLSGAVGLIQFTTVGAAKVGSTRALLGAMTELEQLDFVEKYFKDSTGKLDSLPDVYMAIFAPIGVGKEDAFVLYRSPTEAYRQNSPLDANNDGQITKAEAASRPQQLLITGLSQANIG